MNQLAKRGVAISMRLREDDLDIIDRGARVAGLSRTEFFRRAALHEAQLAILNETVIRFSPEGFDEFVAAIEKPTIDEIPPKLREVLARKAPWERS